MGNSVRWKVVAEAIDALFELKDRYVSKGIVYEDSIVTNIQMVGLEIKFTSQKILKLFVVCYLVECYTISMRQQKLVLLNKRFQISHLLLFL